MPAAATSHALDTSRAARATSRSLSGPIAADEYLAEQRAGYGTPRQAETKYLDARAAANRLSTRSAIAAAGGHAIQSDPWTAIGPAPMSTGVGAAYAAPNSGRIDSLAVSRNGTIFVGTAGGGIWSSADKGASWTTTTDHLSTGLAIGALAADPTNAEIIYAGTGEANICGDCFYGDGVLKSIDGGVTWTVENPKGVFTGVDFSSLLVDPNNDHDLYAATSAGFYESFDSGVKWSLPSGTYENGPATSAVIDPATSPTTIYVATEGVGVQVSTDGGKNFANVDTGLPNAGEFGFTALGIGTDSTTFPLAGQDVYAAVQLAESTAPNGGDVEVFSSTDAGVTWKFLSTPAYTNQSYAYGQGTSDQASYDNVLAVNPVNPAQVFAGGIALIESRNAGTSWSNVDGGNFFAVANVLHPDQHALVFSGGNLYVGNDGGVYELSGSKVSDLNSNIDSGQFYEDLGVYGNGTEILGGLQDNGTAFFDGTEGWPEAMAGDGGYSAINPLDPYQQFGEADEQLYTTSNGWATAPAVITPPQLYKGTLPKYPGGPDPVLNSNFVVPMTIVPNPRSVDEPTIYFGADNLYKTTNPGSPSPSWARITKHSGSDVSSVAVAPSDANILYVGFDDGTLLVSKNAEAAKPTFTDISPGVSDWVTHVAVDPSDPGSVALTFSDSNTQEFSTPPMVETGSVRFASTPAATFSDITGNLPSGVASNSVVFDQGDLVVATDVGVFLTTSAKATSTVWARAGTGLPNVQVIGLTVDGTGDLFAATHGRGVWELRVPSKPAVTIQPRAQLVTVSTTASFSATASGSPTPTVQWQASTNGGKTFADVTGGTSSTLSVTSATLNVTHTSTAMSGTEYRAVFTNSLGRATSASATLTVVPGLPWSILPNPNLTTQQALLAGLSCPSATSCAAVGGYLNSSFIGVGLAESWNGKKWAIEASPNPTGANYISLSAVSCVSAAACTAVGYYLNQAENSVTLAESWNGKKWAIEQSPNPAGAKGSSLVGVSCASDAACTAVGDYVNKSGNTVPLVEVWNGTKWAIKPSLNPTGAKYSSLSAVSCTSAAACTAVGDYLNSAFRSVALAESWNGTKWAIQPTSSPAGSMGDSLSGVSCSSATACTAVGYYGNRLDLDLTLAESWNGTKWAIEPIPNPAGSPDSNLSAVSCTLAAACKAVGFYTNSAQSQVPLTERQS